MPHRERSTVNINTHSNYTLVTEMTHNISVISNMNGLKLPIKRKRFSSWLIKQTTLKFVSKNPLVDAKSRVESLRLKIFALSPRVSTDCLLAAKGKIITV